MGTGESADGDVGDVGTWLKVSVHQVWPESALHLVKAACNASNE